MPQCPKELAGQPRRIEQQRLQQVYQKEVVEGPLQAVVVVQAQMVAVVRNSNEHEKIKKARISTRCSLTPIALYAAY